MVDKLTRYEIKILNRVIFKTYENTDFDIFQIVTDFNHMSSGFDKSYVPSPDIIAMRIGNFLIDKRLAEKVNPNHPAFERILRWTNKGVRLKKYGNYGRYNFMVEILPEISRLTIWLGGIIGACWCLVQILKLCKN